MFKNLKDKAKAALEEQATRLNELKDKAAETVQGRIKDLGDKTTETLSETSERLKGVRDNVAQHLDEKREDLQALKDKALHALTLEHLVPQVRDILAQKVVPLLSIKTLAQTLGEDRIEGAFRAAYEFLPIPVRLVVSEDAFVRYCLSNQTHILDQGTERKLLSTQAPSRSAADELLKLKQLLDNGVLTEEEFGVFKRQLMEQ